MRAASALIALSVLLSACAFDRDGPPRRTQRVPTGDGAPVPEPRSRYGNPAFYEVFGQRYHVMPSAAGYHERGIASWYGKKFHGRRTSSGEVYDMHQVSAAHKTLPLPTWVRVTNLDNGRSLILRVNDRGPFVHKRIIDLSYAAALKLDVVGAGTARVEVEAITFDERGAQHQSSPNPVSSQATLTPAAVKIADSESLQDSDLSAVPKNPNAVTYASEGARVASATPATTAPASSELTTTAAGGLTMQVGAFSDLLNAHRRVVIIEESGITPVFVNIAGSESKPVFRVRIGPLASVAEYDAVVKRLAEIGIRAAHLVTETSGS